jgi:hypothetical protein
MTHNDGARVITRTIHLQHYRESSTNSQRLWEIIRCSICQELNFFSLLCFDAFSETPLTWVKCKAKTSQKIAHKSHTRRLISSIKTKLNLNVNGRCLVSHKLFKLFKPHTISVRCNLRLVSIYWLRYAL